MQGYKCPHCGGLLYFDDDGYEQQYTCIMCARTFSLTGRPKGMTPSELSRRLVINPLTKERTIW